jgi:quercetin dioxygenase-like cupin family protein
MASEYEIVDPASIDREAFPESGVAHAKLTAALGAEAVRVNQVRVEPGEVVGYHTHATQEEVYICQDGPGEVYLDGTHREVPEGAVLRIAPSVPRQVLNTGEEPATWIMVGAPPVGTREDFGEYQVAEGGYESDS